jgi:hypothetical protein
MHAWYKRKLLDRLGAAWPSSLLRPVDVQEVDTRTWLVTYQHAETREVTSSLLKKQELRQQEREQSLLARGLDADTLGQMMQTCLTHGTEHASHPPVVLNFSPDTAYYNIRPTDWQFQPLRVELDEGLQEELNALKSKAQELDELVPTRWAFEDQTLFMRDKGGSQFKWILENDKIVLCIGRGKKTGVIGQVRLSSEYLQMDCAGDLGLAVSQVHLFLIQVYGEHIILEQSALDLAADILFLDLPTFNIKECFLSRAVVDEERPVHLDDGYVDGPSCIRRRWKKIAGLAFGMHTSAVSAAIYNKTHEIKHHSPDKRWFYDLWSRRAKALGIEFTSDMIVWRVEVRFKRAAFREFPDVSGAYDVLPHVRDLWAYGVGHVNGGEDGRPDGWLRYVIPSDDTNRARWAVHPAWQVIQQACDEEPLPESEYEQEEREKEELLQQVDAELAARPFACADDAKDQKHPAQKKLVSAAAPDNDLAPESLKPFVRCRKREVNMERGIAQMVGWLSTIEAWRRGYALDRSEQDEDVENDISTTLHFLAEQADLYMAERAIDFAQIVQKKRVLFRLEKAAV